MYGDKSRRCGDRIVSISQPYVRPIIRGKQRKPVEFGAGLSRARRADTSAAWINSIFLVMDLLILLRIFFARCSKGPGSGAITEIANLE